MDDHAPPRHKPADLAGYLEALSRLQDEVEPFPSEEARRAGPVRGRSPIADRDTWPLRVYPTWPHGCRTWTAACPDHRLQPSAA